MDNFLPIGERLREERIRLGFSQDDFSKQVGITRKTLFGYETGIRSPDAGSLATWAKIGVDALYVITGVRSQAVSAPYSPITPSSVSDKKAAEDTGEYDTKLRNRREEAFLKLYNSLSEEAKQDILKDIEEAKRVEDMEKKLQSMSVELARIKKGA